LNADYSIVGLSGQGVIFHGVGVPNMSDGYLMSSPIRNGAASYHFSRKADVVVVNIGTNDYIYRQGAGITEQSFADAYEKLLRDILARNGDACKIVCVYNTMNDTFGDTIPNICNDLGGTDAGIYSFKMNRAASGHPTIAENAAYTDALEGFIREVIQAEKKPGSVIGGTEIWTPFV
jgi:lysophospholipase L1-like esterase